MSRNPIDEQTNNNFYNIHYDHLMKECGVNNLPLYYLQFKHRIKNRIVTGIIADKNRENYDLSCKTVKDVIEVYDNVFNNTTIKTMHNFCKECPLFMSHASINTIKTKALVKKNIFTDIENRWPTFNMNFNRINLIENKYFTELFFNTILPNINLENKDKISIDRLYINTHLLGRSGLIHKDGKAIHEKDRNNVAPTVLIYINDNWNINYDGTTCFLLDDNDDKNIHHVEFKCGRIVMFPAYVSHKQCDTSSYSYRNNCLRYVIAYHLIYNQKMDKY
uniref:Prolyl 4-hydroxylase alpha subunit Fe(2+) 2OG dioxygenase domain-containing protein n=1 Tax=viral metagenome TaxID=1070528 RepID=A0A6C0AY91_9ZZZZ|tara:strand:- start:483 stop:1313 length:831 start_codon:yes stop_codon:yes gene_type:complete